MKRYGYAAIVLSVAFLGTSSWSETTPPASDAPAIDASPSPDSTAPKPEAKKEEPQLDLNHGMNGLVESVTHRTGRMRDPLKYIASDMGHIVGDLSELKTDQPVQQKEEKVVTQLDTLIKELEKACNGAGGGNPNPTRPMNSSRIARGPGGGETHDAKQGDKQWGMLPPKEREKILQSKTEGFPPGYEALLQSYYQRLAREQVTDASDAAKSGPTEKSNPATQPAAQ